MMREKSQPWKIESQYVVVPPYAFSRDLDRVAASASHCPEAPDKSAHIPNSARTNACTSRPSSTPSLSTSDLHGGGPAGGDVSRLINGRMSAVVTLPLPSTSPRGAHGSAAPAI